jgi:predicted nucleic acid-binding Zn ribbon protein
VKWVVTHAAWTFTRKVPSTREHSHARIHIRIRLQHWCIHVGAAPPPQILKYYRDEVTTHSYTSSRVLSKAAD